MASPTEPKYVTMTTSNVPFPPVFKKGSDVPPVTLVPAAVAAQELRTTLHHYKSNPPPAPGLSLPHKNQLGLLLKEIEEQMQQVESHLSLLDEHIASRRVSAGKEQMTLLRLDLARLRHGHTRAMQYMAALPVPKKSQAVNWTRLYQLAQCLPTVDDIPKTPAENTLRAIIALLRNHRWPGVEGLTQNEAKEVTDGSEAEAVKQLADAVGPPAPVGDDPSGGNEGYDDDDNYDEES